MAKQHMRDFKVLATPLWHQQKDWRRDFAPLQHLPECSFCLRDVSGLYYKSFTIVIYDRYDSGQCYKTVYNRNLRS
jgi:hypothetical protein